MRLNVDGIDKLHCLLINGHDGIRIRDLKRRAAPSSTASARNIYCCRMAMFSKSALFSFASNSPRSQRRTPIPRDALRIQVAAVAAQQMALEEEEIRLQKRIADREQQEEQLAAHLAAKQQQLEEWSERTCAEQEALQAEKIEHEKTVAAVNDDLALEQGAIARIIKVDERTTTREQDVHATSPALAKALGTRKGKASTRTDKLEADRRTLQQKHDAFLEREAAFNQELMHFNTERELFMCANRTTAAANSRRTRNAGTNAARSKCRRWNCDTANSTKRRST